MKIKYLLIAIFCFICALGFLFFEHVENFYKRKFLTQKTLAQKLVDNPDSPFINYQQGLQHYKLRQFQKSSKFFNKAASCAGSNKKLRGVALANSANAKYHIAKQLIQPDKKFKKIKSENPKADAIELLQSAIKSYASALESWPEEKVEKNKMIAESLLEQLKRSNDNDKNNNKDDDESNQSQDQDQKDNQSDNQNQSNNNKNNQKNNSPNNSQKKPEPNQSNEPNDSDNEKSPKDQQKQEPKNSLDQSENQPEQNENEENSDQSEQEKNDAQEKDSESSEQQNNSAEQKNESGSKKSQKDAQEEQQTDSEFQGIEEESESKEEQEGQAAAMDEKSEEEAAEEKYAQMLKALSRQNFNDKLDKMESESEKVVKALIKAKTQGNLKNSKPNYGW